jgi:hypothetical protein
VALKQIVLVQTFPDESFEYIRLDAQEMRELFNQSEASVEKDTVARKPRKITRDGREWRNLVKLYFMAGVSVLESNF